MENRPDQQAAPENHVTNAEATHRVWEESLDESDGYEVKAGRPEWAAEDGAEKFHNDSGGEWMQDNRIFIVRDLRDGTVTRWDVSIDWNPSFWAWDIEEPSP